MDPTDLDDELLALAGEGDDQPSSPDPKDSPAPKGSPTPEDATTPKSTPKESVAHKKSASPAASTAHKESAATKVAKKAASPSSSKSNANAALKGVARKMNKRTAATRPTLTIESDQDEPSDEDEPSARAASPASEGSAAMDESEDESPTVGTSKTLAPAETSSDGSGPKYPVEGKFLSLADKSEILSLPEARREEVLANRAEEVAAEKFSKQLRQRHEEQQQLTSKTAQPTGRKKRSATAAELERDSPRPSKKTTASKQLQRYKQQREQTNERRRRDDDRRAQGRSLSARSSSSPESDALPAEPALHPDGQLDVDLHAANKVRLSRRDLPSICFTPGFDEIVPGCFIRVAKGPDEHGRMRYQAYMVKSIQCRAPYSITTYSGNELYTDQHFRPVLKEGDGGPYPFTHCSDSPITADEWDAFKKEFARTSARLPTRAAVDVKHSWLRYLHQYSWTNADITAKINRVAGLRAIAEKAAAKAAASSGQGQGRQQASANGGQSTTNGEQGRADARQPEHETVENEIMARRMRAVNEEVYNSTMQAARPKPKKKPVKREDGELKAGAPNKAGSTSKEVNDKFPSGLTDDEIRTLVAQSIEIDIDIGV